MYYENKFTTFTYKNREKFNFTHVHVHRIHRNSISITCCNVLFKDFFEPLFKMMKDILKKPGKGLGLFVLLIKLTLRLHSYGCNGGAHNDYSKSDQMFYRIGASPN